MLVTIGALRVNEAFSCRALNKWLSIGHLNAPLNISCIGICSRWLNGINLA